MSIRLLAPLMAVCLFCSGLMAQSVWTGAVSTSWTDTNNWSPTVVPTAADSVLISPPAIFMPTLVVGAACNNITISVGATLTGGAGTLAVSGNFINNGTYVPGTAQINLVGAVNTTIGGASVTAIDRLLISKTALTTIVTMTGDLNLTNPAQSTTVGANGLDIQTGSFVTSGFNLSVPGRVNGNANGELRVTVGGTVTLNSIYQWNLGYMKVDAGTVNISGTHEVVNGGHRFDMTGGIVNYTATGLTNNLRLLTNNLPWGYWVTGGEVRLAGSIEMSISSHMQVSGTGILRFVGSVNSQVNTCNLNIITSANTFSVSDMRVEKTGNTTVSILNTGGVGRPNDLVATSLTVNSGAGISIGGLFAAGFAWKIGSVNNSGTVTWVSDPIQVTGGLSTNPGATMTGVLGSKVLLVGAAASNMLGNNGFYNLVCTVAGRQINFAPGSNTTITGLLTLIGTAASPIILRSGTLGQTYTFTNQGAYVRYVDVRDCIATTTIVNGPGGIDSGNNTNWNFGGGLAVLAVEGAPTSVNANDKGVGNAGRQAGSFDIDNATAGPMTLTSLSLTAGGTANDSTAYTEVALYVDNNAGGTAGSFDPTDTLYGTTVAAFPANDGTQVFTANLVVNAAQTRKILVVVKLDGAPPAAAGQTLLTRISAMTVQAGIVAGTPANFTTGLLISAPNINMTYPANPANNPKQVPATYTGPGGLGFELTQFVAVVTGTAPVNITSLTLTNIGSAVTTPAASTMYTRFELYKDSNGNSVWDPADVRIGVNTPVLPSNFAFQVAEQGHAGLSSTLYFVIGGLNSPNLGPNGTTFNFYISNMIVTSAYPGATFAGTGQVRNGATINTSATQGMLFTRAADSAVATATQTDTGPGGNGLQAGKFAVENMSATTAGSLTSFTLTLTSSAATFIPRSYTELKFFQDTNSSGVWDAGDAQVGATVLGAALGAAAVTSAAVPTFTAALPINFPANSTTYFFLVVKFNGTPLPTAGVTYRSFISAVGVGATTTSSGVSTGNAAGAFIVPNQLVVLATAGAPAIEFSNAQGPGNQGIEAGKFTITANNTPGSNLLSISIQASGTGDDSTAFQEIAVYRDGAAGAVGSYDAASDILIGTAAGFPANDGTLLFNVPAPEQSFAASEARTYFVVARLANTAVPAQTLQVRVSDIGVNLGKGGVPSAVMAGITIKSPVFTITDNSPAQGTGFAGQGGFLIQQFTIGYPAGPDNTLTDLTFTGVTTTGNVQTDITPVQLYRDANANGTFEAATDTLLQSIPNFGVGNQVMFTLGGAESQFSASATDRQYFVVVGFVVTTPNQSIFQTQLMAAAGASVGSTINGTPAPAGGAAPGLEVLANNLLLTLNGPQAALSVDNTAQGPGDIGLVLWDGTLATISGAWLVNDITFTATGTANQTTAYSYVSLWEDSNNSGAFDGAVGGDNLADPAPVGGFTGGVYTATLNNQNFPGQTARRFFLVVKLAGTATTGQTLNAELTSLNGTGPVGGQLSGDIAVSSTALIIDLPSVTAFGAPTGPAAQTIKAGTVQTVLVGKIRLAATNNDVDVTGVTLTGTGTGDWATDISTVEVWQDNGDGLFAAASDAMIFTGASGLTVTATFTSNVVVPNSGHKDLWVRVTCTATAAAGESVSKTYIIGIANAGDIVTTAAPLLGAPAAQSAVLGIVDFFVTDFTPPADFLIGGKDIVITGSGFATPFQVRIGGTICPGVAVVTPTGVTGLTVPAGSGINLPIEIDSGTLATQTLTQTFNYVTVTKPKVSTDGCVAATATPWMGLMAPALLAIVALRRRRK